jgi:hypothetical protein
MRLPMLLDLKSQVEGSIMFLRKLVTRLARTFAQRLWLLVLPLAMLNAACAGLTSSSGKPATGDTTPPTVSITSPAPAATVSGTITVTAIASDNVAVASVQFQVDGSNFGTLVTSAPYTVSLNTATLSNGKHSLTAVAIDTSGNKATSVAVSITVSNSGDTTPPTVSITSPASGATVSGTITVTANASDNVAVASVQFQVDGSNLGAAVTSAPYSTSVNTTTLTNGAHTLKAIATDTSNNKTTSAGVSISVSNTNSSPVTVSITSPAPGATVSGTISVTANASAGAGVASVQFLLDGSNLSSADTTSPYAVSWDTTTASNGSHTLAAKATDKSGNTATSSNVTVNVSQSAIPPPPPPAGDTVTISDASGLGQTSAPVSISRPFVQGEIANFAQASIGGAALVTQCDVKNRWPDGSLKFAVVSFVVPSIPANGSVVVSFSNQTSGNNTGFLAPSDMLNSAYNFDGQIQLSGTANHNISARAILNGASNCVTPTSDLDGTLSTSGNTCVYWLQGPIVTAVLLEDRIGRSFDVNTDGETGNPLHPMFEAWFYPQTKQIQLGYSLENDWASTTATNSARDQTYSYALTAGNSSPMTIYTQASETVLTRTRWHKTFCVNGTGIGTRNGCDVGSITINHNWPYLAATKFFLNWDPTFQFQTSSTGCSSECPTPANFVTAWTSPVTNKTDTLNSNGLGFYPGYQTNCGDSVENTTGDSCGGGTGFDAGGMAYYHGPLTTWDIDCLLTQAPTLCNTVTLGSADVSGGVPYWFREADVQPNGHFFDSPNNTVPTQGRVISINARTNLDTADVTTTQSAGGCLIAAEAVNYGGSGQDLGNWGGGQLDVSHWPNTSYVAYTRTGQYAYYEQQVMQGANAVGNVGGSYACPGSGGHRQGALGYWNYLDGDRTEMWAAREIVLGATVAINGSPEQAYLVDKLRTNLAVLEAGHSIPCDIPGTGVQEPYCGSTNNTAYGFGVNSRNFLPFLPVINGSAFGGSSGYSCTGSPCSWANGNFMNAYSNVMLGWIDDLGFCPHTNGTCQLLQYTENFLINMVSDPTGPGLYGLGDYTYPTYGGTVGAEINLTNLASMGPYYSGGIPRPSSVWNVGECSDEGYAAESAAALSYGYPLTSTANPGYTGTVGYSGAAAYNTLRTTLIASCTQTPTPFSLSPKWDIIPRQ